MNVFTSPLSSKNQVTVPTEVREALKIDSPDYEIVWIKISNGDILVHAQKKLAEGENPFLRICGYFGDTGKTDIVGEYLEEKKAEAKRENL